MDKATFETYRAAGFNRIPVFREILADLDTPLSTFLKLAGSSNSFLFESVEGGERWGRYSIIGLPARIRISVRGNAVELVEDGSANHCTVEDPLAWIEAFRGRFRAPEIAELPPFSGGLVGYFGYGTVQYIENRLAGDTRPDPLDCPDIVLMLADELVIFDNLRGTLFLIVHADGAAANDWDRAVRRLDELENQLRQPLPYPRSRPVSASGSLRFGFAQQDFCQAVKRIQRYILDGDVMQAVLSQRISQPFAGAALDVYRALRCMNPSPYMYYLQFEGFHVVGSSPEVLARLQSGVIQLRPIAGTRPRGRSEREDLGLEQELLADPKERAEHLMLIDLGRNDIGRVSRIGSVRVTENMKIERYSHVMHIVSCVTGELVEGLGPVDVLRACFPAGTLSGAPKVRAMEIINELEPVRRGIYAGAVGYIGWNGNMDTAIAIRTAVVQEGLLHIQAGAGIVHDSVPEREWQETLSKAQALLKATDMVAQGLAVSGGEGA